MDITSMGVDVNEGPQTTLDNKLKEEKMRESVDDLDRFIKASTMSLQNKKDESEIESDKLVESGKEKEEKSDGERDTREDEESKTVVKRRPKKSQRSNRTQQVRMCVQANRWK